MTEKDVRRLLIEVCVDAGSTRAWALANDLSPQYVGDVLKGKRSLGPSILKALGIEAVTTYKRVRK